MIIIFFDCRAIIPSPNSNLCVFVMGFLHRSRESRRWNCTWPTGLRIMRAGYCTCVPVMCVPLTHCCHQRRLCSHSCSPLSRDASSPSASSSPIGACFVRSISGRRRCPFAVPRARIVLAYIFFLSSFCPSACVGTDGCVLTATPSVSGVAPMSDCTLLAACSANDVALVSHLSHGACCPDHALCACTAYRVVL